MRVAIRIRTAPERQIRRNRRPNRGLARIAASICLPAALVCFLVCAWRWSYDLAWTSRFVVADGLLSHWQVWFVAGTVLQVIAIRLSRYADAESPLRASDSDPVAHPELL